jgi:hypothetical protein
VPFLTPRGGICLLLGRLHELDAPHPRPANPFRVSTPGLRGYQGRDNEIAEVTEGDEMYIGGGILTVILIVLLLVWIF